MNRVSIIVLGGLNTDIAGLEVSSLIGEGELSFGGQLKIGPGGKSRNIAQMASILLGKNKVAMIGRTCMDPYGLWRLPVDALKISGVNTDYIKVQKCRNRKTYPGVALIAVDNSGNNQIYVLPGVNNDFSRKDIDNAIPLFLESAKNNGILAMSLELPVKTAEHGIKIASRYSLKTVLDPGGIVKGQNYSTLFSNTIYLIKPNEQEAKLLTGIDIIDFQSARKAADILLGKGVENVLFTIGKKGAYLFSKTIGLFIPTPVLSIKGARDSTGCGDQVTATVCTSLIEGKSVLDAAKLGILTGAIEFTKQGIVPVTKKEIRMFSNRLKE
jgi:ribokinase